MKKDIRINPVGLKGNQINERMKELMGIAPINENENKSTSVIELTKIGPDGKAYAIVRENHEYYIKTATKKDNLVSEDFKYIGGLMNKKNESYPSYAKAIKRLNLKFNSIAESLNKTNDINVFENDNLINESGVAGFSDMQSGFSGEGNLEGNKPLEETEGGEADDVELTEVEAAVESMLEEKPEVEEKKVNETHKLSISRALENMDSIIDGLTTESVKKKIYTLK